MYDVKPGHEHVPELAAHMAARRARTLEAIRRGLLPDTEDYDAPNALADRLAERVLASLEQMWREDEVFT